MAGFLSIEDICKEVVKTDALNACNFFIQEVARKIFSGTVPDYLKGTANEIVPRLSVKGNFIPLVSGDSATKYAEEGYFVIGGVAKTSGSGHVFVVVPGGPSPKGIATPWKDKKGQPFLSAGGFPYAYNGSSAAALRIPARISPDLMFSKDDMKVIKYGAVIDPRNPPKCPAGSSEAASMQISCPTP